MLYSINWYYTVVYCIIRLVRNDILFGLRVKGRAFIVVLVECINNGVSFGIIQMFVYLDSKLFFWMLGGTCRTEYLHLTMGKMSGSCNLYDV